jgi:hypothetical protein
MQISTRIIGTTPTARLTLFQGHKAATGKLFISGWEKSENKVNQKSFVKYRPALLASDFFC